MGLHGGAWRVHSSAVDDTEIIRQSLSWLCGSGVQVSMNYDKSSIGAKMCVFECKMKSREAEESLMRIDRESIRTILHENLDARVDEEKNLHVRLDLSKLVRGEAKLSEHHNPSVVKGKFKLEVYQGQEATKIAEELLSSMIN